MEYGHFVLWMHFCCVLLQVTHCWNKDWLQVLLIKVCAEAREDIREL